MKLLKKHGKKVSVALLALALILTPMLNVVNAAEETTCQIRYHYFYNEAENAYIEQKYTRNDDTPVIEQFSSSEDTSWNTVDAPQTITQNSHTYQYTLHFGLNGIFQNDTGAVYRAKLTDEAAAEEDRNDGWLKNGNTGMDKGANYFFGLQSKYNTTNGNFIGNSNNSLLNPANNFSMKSKGTFYNLEIPDGFKVKSVEMTPGWSDKEYEIYFDMYAKAVKSAKENNGKAADDTTYSGADEDYYFIHYEWTNENTGDNGYSSGYDGDLLKDSDSTNALSWEINNLDKVNVSDVIAKLKKASIDVPSQWDDEAVRNLKESVGNTDLYPTLSPKITRTYTNIDKKQLNDADYYKGHTEKQPSKFVGYDVQDTYNWYFLPAMGVVTFEGTGDVCTVNTGDESNEGNPGTGVASYAIIGTLLVGAASAYIYARKNNKFNRV